MSPRHLLLLRHAKAMPMEPDGSDHDRALSGSGRLDAAAMGLLLRRRGLAPTLALISAALRTRETFDQLVPFAGPPPRRIISDALYLAQPDTLLEVLREHGSDEDDILLVGHNPGLHELAWSLSGGDPVLQHGFPTCTLALFSIEGDRPSPISGHAILLDVLRP